MPELSIWSREKNTAMKVFSQLYVGLQKAGQGVPLGFATPYEQNAAGRKRQDTVNTWAAGYGRWVDGEYIKGEPTVRIIENEPAPGFKITDDVKRVYWGGGNVVWRVEDPRGFELEIQSNNLMAIIQSAGVNEGGLIPGQCVWGRSGGDNILLHETSDEYKDAVKAAETLKAPKQVGKSSRRVGGVYRCVDGSLGIYLGKLHVTKLDYETEESKEAAPWINVGVPTLPGRILLDQSTFKLAPSAEFEGVLSVEQGPNDKPLAGQSLKLYKKAPLVDDTGLLLADALLVDDDYLRGLYWSFASTSISCKRILSVTKNPILNPVPKVTPWSAKQFADRMETIKRYVKQNCGTGPWRYRLPLSSILSQWQVDEVVRIDGKLYSSIAVIGEESRRANEPNTAIDVALPVEMGPGFIRWRSGITKPSYHGAAWSSYLDRVGGPYQPEPTTFLKMPQFDTPDGLYEYLQSLYDTSSLLYVTCEEANA